MKGWSNLPGDDMDLGEGQGQQRGGRKYLGNGGRFSNATRGSETSGGGWRMAGAGNVQVDSAPLWERRWGVGDTERCYKN